MPLYPQPFYFYIYAMLAEQIKWERIFSSVAKTRAVEIQLTGIHLLLLLFFWYTTDLFKKAKQWISAFDIPIKL